MDEVIRKSDVEPIVHTLLMHVPPEVAIRERINFNNIHSEEKCCECCEYYGDCKMHNTFWKGED